MKMLVAVGIASLLTLQATGLELAVAPLNCAQTCPTDGQDGACAPLCTDCFCCPTLRSCVQVEGQLPSPLISMPAGEPEQTPAPLRANPSEIFHIPRIALA